MTEEQPTHTDTEEASGTMGEQPVETEQSADPVPRHTRPFRAWGAAHEPEAPSLWARFVGWLRSLFSRKHDEIQPVDEHVELESMEEPEEYARLIEKPSVAELEAPPAAEADAIWDTPVVAEAPPAPAPTLEASDFSEVWQERKSPLEGIDWKSIEEQSKPQGFFARLFSRKKKDEPVDDFPVNAPADADFAEDAAAATVPADDDFAAPSLEHSQEDSASLAAFLLEGRAEEREEQREEQREEEREEQREEEREEQREEVRGEALDAEFRPFVPAAAADPKKAGFFSGLLKRVSRSQFVPKEVAEPQPELELVVEPVVEPVAELAVEPASEAEVIEAAPVPEPEPVADEMADLGETVPVPMPAVPPPVFRDARDDFADEDAATNSRATEKVEVPSDEGEKTDEFQVVPPPAPATEMGSTAETRQFAGFISRMFGRKEDRPRSEMPTMGMPDDKMPFVLAKFRSFYNEVIRDKHQKSDVISGFATAVMGAGGATTDSDPEFAAQLLSKRLSEMLELQAAESNWTGGDAAKYYPEAQYAMVALADETFATIDWVGRSSWHKYMLEPKMYGTRGAEIEFFKRIDRLLKEAPDEKGARDLARLYLMVIASGYRGKFRVPNVRRPLAEYRRRLYEYSHQMDPLELYGRERRVFPQASAHTLVSRSVGRFSPTQRWVAVVVVLAALYIGVSHYAWTRVSADLRDVMSRIQSSLSQPGPR